MEPIINHFREYVVLYIAGAAAGVPLIYFTRKWSVPLLQYLIEISIYLILMHGLMWIFVKLAVWFKDQTSMKRAFSDTGERPDWFTPLLNFWDKDVYNPSWLFWLEMVLVVGIFYGVWRFRPLRFQHKKRERKFTNESSKRYAQGNRSAGSSSTLNNPRKTWRGGRRRS